MTLITLHPRMLTHLKHIHPSPTALYPPPTFGHPADDTAHHRDDIYKHT